MENDKKVECSIVRAAWCATAAAQLAATIRGNPCYSIEDLRAECVSGAADLFRVDAPGGELVGYVVMRIEIFSQGAEGVIVAGAGKLAGARLYGHVVPALERMFRGVKTYRIESCRRGAADELEALGYLPTHVVYRKVAPLEIRSRDDVLEDLAACTERGGPDLRGFQGAGDPSKPGRAYGGGGGSSATSSNSTQSTNNVDRRVVADAGSIVLGDSGAVTLTQSDFGSVQAAIGLARDVSASAGTASAAALKGAIDLARSSSADTIGLTRDLFANSLTVLDKAGRQVEQQSAIVAQAYDAAKGAGTEKTILTVAALAAVALVAIPVALRSFK